MSPCHTVAVSFPVLSVYPAIMNINYVLCNYSSLIVYITIVPIISADFVCLHWDTWNKLQYTLLAWIGLGFTLTLTHDCSPVLGGVKNRVLSLSWGSIISIFVSWIGPGFIDSSVPPYTNSRWVPSLPRGGPWVGLRFQLCNIVLTWSSLQSNSNLLHSQKNNKSASWSIPFMRLHPRIM